MTVTPNAIKSMIAFLVEVDVYPCLYFNHSVIADAVYRYEHFWLPLLLATPQRVRASLAPPLDVHWVWHCHMLCPHRYTEDCVRILAAHGAPLKGDTIFEHAVLTASACRSARAAAQPKWEAMFPAEPFDVTDRLRAASMIDTETTPPARAASKKSHIMYNIAASAERQMTFHYQVAVMPHFQSSAFLSLGVSRYIDFLNLGRRNRDTVIVPTYDIDAAWHVHMLHPQRYVKCCRKLFGDFFKHDDSMNDRTEGSSLNRQWDITRSLWYETYKSPMPRPGAMWRGNPTAEERSLRPTIQAMVQAFLKDRKYTGPFTVVHDPASLLRHTNRDDYNRVPWVHTTISRQVAERCDCSRELNTSFTEVDTSFVRRLSTLRDSTGTSVLSSLVTAFVDEADSGMCDRYLHNVLEIFQSDVGVTGSGGLPIATAHTAMAGSTIHPPNMQENMGPKAVMVLRVGGVDVGLLGGYWTGFNQPGTRWQSAPVQNGTPKTWSQETRPGTLRLYFADLTGERAKGVGNDATMWTEIGWKSNETLEPRTYSMVVPDVRKLICGGATAGDRSLSSTPTNGQVTVDLSQGLLKVDKQEDLLMGYLISLSAAALFVQLQPKFEPSEKTGIKNENCAMGQSMYPAWSTTQGKYEILRAVGGEHMGTDGKCTGAGRMLANKIGGDKCFIGNTDMILSWMEKKN